MGPTTLSRKNSCAADAALTFSPRGIDRWGATAAAISVMRGHATSCPSTTDLSNPMNSDALRSASSKIVSTIDVSSQAASRTSALRRIARPPRPGFARNRIAPTTAGSLMLSFALASPCESSACQSPRPHRFEPAFNQEWLVARPKAEILPRVGSPPQSAHIIR